MNFLWEKRAISGTQIEHINEKIFNETEIHLILNKNDTMQVFKYEKNYYMHLNY